MDSAVFDTAKLALQVTSDTQGSNGIWWASDPSVWERWVNGNAMKGFLPCDQPAASGPNEGLGMFEGIWIGADGISVYQEFWYEADEQYFHYGGNGKADCVLKQKGNLIAVIRGQSVIMLIWVP